MSDGPADEPELTAEERAWVDGQLAISAEYHARLTDIIRAYAAAMVHQGDCDVCHAILDMVPRDVPDFIAAFDRAGPVLGQERITVGGVWTFDRAAYLWHESQHGG